MLETLFRRPREFSHYAVCPVIQHLLVVRLTVMGPEQRERQHRRGGIYVEARQTFFDISLKPLVDNLI